jgi:hypothetical protein
MNITTRPPQPPADDGYERLTKLIAKAEDFIASFDAFDELTQEPRDRLLSQYSAAEIEEAGAELLAQIDEFEAALAQFGDYSEQVSLRLILLVASFPNLAPHNVEGFLAMLTRTVLSKRPSILVLESACRAVVENEKSFSIAAVLAAIEEAAERFAPLQRRGTISYETTRMLAARAQQQAKAEAERAQREQWFLAELDRDGHAELAAAVRAGTVTAEDAKRAIEGLQKIRREHYGVIAVRRRRLSILGERLDAAKAKARFEVEWYGDELQLRELAKHSRRMLWQNLSEAQRNRILSRFASLERG